MANISVSLPSDGETIDVADYNTPINTIVNEINGRLDNSNIASDAAIAGSKLADTSVTNAKLATGAGEPGASFLTYTPVLTNITIGNGTVDFKSATIGKLVTLRFRITFGSTTSLSGQPTFSLPFTAVDYGTGSNINSLGTGVYRDDSAANNYPIVIRLASTTTASTAHQAVSGALIITGGASSTAPFTWALTDSITGQLQYEMA